jgi:hypothetical protein
LADRPYIVVAWNTPLCTQYSRHFLVNVETAYTELSSVNAHVLQDSVLGPLLYLIYTADLPTSPESTTPTYAYNTAEVATDSD